MPDENASQPPTPAERLAQLAFTVLHDVYHLGDDLTSVRLDDLAARITRIHAGINPQSEFQAINVWLGQAIALGITDAGRDNIERIGRAPDYMLISHTQGRDLPVLVEVKTSEDEELVWTQSYFSSLERFASILKLPLLVAWKHHGMWALVDTTHFALRATAYHLTFEKALRENLMYLLCGELLVMLDEEFQFIITAEIEEPLPPREELLLPNTYTMKITDASFRTRHGPLELRNEFFWLFAAGEEDNHIERPTQQTIKAIHYAGPGNIFPLTRVLFAQLAARHGDAPIDWNAELRQRPFPSAGVTYKDCLNDAINAGVVRIVGQQMPNTMPVFLATPQE